MLELWMQNGVTALSKIRFNQKQDLKREHIQRLLVPIYTKDGERSRISSYLFHSISFIKGAKRDTDRDRLARHLHKVLKSKADSKRLCIYCGNVGGKEVPSYIFPFITMREKYPNAYSMGKIQSLNFCSKCMVISFASNSRWLYRASITKSKIEFISAIMFFSKDADALARFYTSFIGEKDLYPSAFSNMKVFQSESTKGAKQKYQYTYDKTWYAEELLAILIDFLSTKIKLFRMLDKKLGALLFSIRRKLGTLNPTNIYDSFEVIDDLYPFINAISTLKSVTKRDDAFRILFRNLREDEASPLNTSGFVDRGRFFRRLFVYGVIDWKVIENLVMLKASGSRSIPFLKPFIIAVLEELSLSSEMNTFRNANAIGKILGSNMKAKETNPNRLKKMLFDFRRCRTPNDFLTLLNLVQVQTGTEIYDREAHVFVNDNDFEIAKPGFLIGFANAIFKKDQKESKNEAVIT